MFQNFKFKILVNIQLKLRHLRGLKHIYKAPWVNTHGYYPYAANAAEQISAIEPV
jgi:hypothetical protein